MTTLPATDKLHEIAELVFNHIENGQIYIVDNMGLYSGHSGILVFLANYVNHFNIDGKKQDIYNQYLESYFDKLTDGVSLYTYCSGLSGIMTALRLLNKNGLLDIDYSDIESNYYNSMLARMDYDILSGNYDFMHGGLGCALYFQDDKTFIEHAVLGLDHTAIKDGDKIKWKSGLGENRGVGFNIALSHGISSIIIYLSRIYNKGVLGDKVAAMLNGAVNYVLSQEIDHPQYGCYFPSQSLENGDPIYRSRLAWCYGDLGVAAALWQAGKVAKNQEWKQKAIEVYEYSASRLSCADNMVRDAGICHGSAGVAMMFSYMYNETKIGKFKESRDFWLNTTLEFAYFQDGWAGYKTVQSDQAGDGLEWVNSHILLEGIVGVGLIFKVNYSEEILFKLMLLY